MPDSRFYDVHGPRSLADLVNAAGATLVKGDPQKHITDVSSLAGAGPEDACYVLNKRVLKQAGRLSAGLCFCPQFLVSMLDGSGVYGIAVSENPQAAFARAAVLLASPKALSTAGPWVSKEADIDAKARIDPAARIGAGVRIGAETWVGPFASLEPGCQIGRNCRIGSGASIAFSIIGDDVDIRPGAVIGQAGLGVFSTSQGKRAMPHFGIVRIGDGVRIGANSCIDRAVFDETVIGARTQIDNQVQIGHNARIGKDCVLAGMCGVSGSTILDDDVILGARAGLSDHVHIGKGAQIGAYSGVNRDIGPGEICLGVPARPYRRFAREQVALKKLAERKGGKGDG